MTIDFGRIFLFFRSTAYLPLCTLGYLDQKCHALLYFFLIVLIHYSVVSEASHFDVVVRNTSEGLITLRTAWSLCSLIPTSPESECRISLPEGQTINLAVHWFTTHLVF